MVTESAKLLVELREKGNLSQSKIATLLGASLVSVHRWERGASTPSPAINERIVQLHESFVRGSSTEHKIHAFASRGIRNRARGQAVLGENLRTVPLCSEPGPPILSRLIAGEVFDKAGKESVASVLGAHAEKANTCPEPFHGSISAGKNTYTYDAHTYHTKVPPQGIAELIKYYLPDGGLVLDPFAGSGMTGVAALSIGADCILNELSPAACFISSCFTSAVISATEFEAAVDSILAELSTLRRQLYSTQCRECGRSTELLYAVWSFRVLCDSCGIEFQLWDVCRQYGRVVKEHKILTEFDCPSCGTKLRKATLRRTLPEPVLVGYKCCGSKQQERTHPPNDADFDLIRSINENPQLAEGFFPTTEIPDGVNLRQPKKHGFDRIDKFYTRRNLCALSHIWKTIHRIESPELAAHLAFVFTSLYQRVTRLSEFRFWGGSGNTAHFNVPFISNESNVFITFERKARTIQDHLEATAKLYRGRALVINGSATNLSYLPENSIDFIFTDPPFGANINYSEMNLLWESWLGAFTDNTDEAVVNRVQGKGIEQYESLMTRSLQECYRVLRSGHWLLLVFMNSSAEVWHALRSAISRSGFEIKRIDSFDKQHGTFKQFVSDNTAGMDLVLHCMKTTREFVLNMAEASSDRNTDVISFLKSRDHLLPTNIYLHVGREIEVDFRTLYSEWLSHAFQRSAKLVDFSTFRETVSNWLKHEGKVETA